MLYIVGIFSGIRLRREASIVALNIVRTGFYSIVRGIRSDSRAVSFNIKG